MTITTKQGTKQKVPLKDLPKTLLELVKGFFSRLLYILKLVWEARKSLLLVMVLLALFDGISPVISAYISAHLLNQVAMVLSSGSAWQQFIAVLLPALLLKFGFTFLAGFISTVGSMITRSSSELVTNHIRIKIMEKAKDIDLASFDMPEFYEKLENANREVGSRPIQVIQATFRIFSSLISMFSFIAILAAISWFAPLLVILLSLPSAIITFSYRKKTFRYMRRRSKERRQMSYYANALVNKDLVKELRLFDLADTFIDRYRQVFKTYYKGIKKLVSEEGFWNIGINLLSNIVNCGLFFYIICHVAQGQGSIGDYSLYTGALASIAACVSTLVSTTSSIYEGTLFIDNMILFMQEPQRIKPLINEPRHVQCNCGHTIVFDNVSFRYPGSSRDVIKNVSFTINAGDTILLVGLNGAGKTTLIKLLTRLYDPTEGRILLDGHDLRDYDTKELYAMFGIIFQDFGKYAFSVGDNIAFGEIHRDNDPVNIEAAAQASSADEFIQKLPQGYDTALTRYFDEKGIELSIGQWQKLSIARAFYSDSDVLILDEPTASVDAIAEQEIYSQFDRLRQDKTTFFVSHRLSCATIANKILVLQDGQLVEEGSHSQLMALHGIYYTLFSTQAKHYLEVEQ